MHFAVIVFPGSNCDRDVEVALKKSSDDGGKRIDLPLKDRSLGINFDWFR